MTSEDWQHVTDFAADDPSRGLITNVQRFSIHDGPGIRTTVFFKGCPLGCFWCHNPEARRARMEIQYFPERCIGCGLCLTACPHGAHQLLRLPAGNGTGETEERRIFDRSLCRACGRCVETCYAEALTMAGRWWTAGELLDLVLRDREFYKQSGGGVTLSGGEPTLQHGFALEILRLARQVGLHTAIETAAYCRWEILAGLLPWLDLVIMDVKLMDDAGHRAATGVSNRLILENAQRLAGCGLPLLVRTPVVPGVNDMPAAIEAVARFIRSFPNLLYYELMPFHRMAAGKYRSLGMPYTASDLEPPGRETMEALAACARGAGVREVKTG